MDEDYDNNLSPEKNDGLRAICYEQIKDPFYYGIFGDFKLVVDKSTGYFNASKLCNSGGKEYKFWTRLESTRKLFKYYEQFWGSNGNPKIYQINKGIDNDKLENQFTGTYVPKELILDIASWVSVAFYDRCNQIIINYFIEEFKTMDNEILKQKIKEAEEKMEKLNLEKEAVIVENSELKEILLRQDQYIKSLGISLEEVKDQNEELIEHNTDLKRSVNNLKCDIKDIKGKLGIPNDIRPPQSDCESKYERFVLIKRNDKDYYPYYIIKAQDAYVSRKLKIERINFPKLKVLSDFKCRPNSKILYTRIKDNLKIRGVLFKGTNIDLEYTSVTEKDLKEEMNVLRR